MVTEADQIQRLRNQLADRLRAKEAEVVEIQEMIRTLAAVPKVLGESHAAPRHEEKQKTGPQVHNKGLADNVRQYVELTDYDTAINIVDMIKSLKENAGVEGKKESLYAYIHTLLKKMALQNVVRHEKGVGFYKTRKTPKQEQQSTLVASDTLSSTLE